MIKLSKVSKLDGIRSWSLPARKTCPGSLNPDGTLVPVCQGCYAAEGKYRFKEPTQLRENNLKDWKRKNWVKDMVKALSNYQYFRWLDSGDVYCPELAEKIKEVVKQTPNTKHWLSTRMYKVPKVKKILDKVNRFHNASVRYSADTFDGKYIKGLHGACVVAPGVRTTAFRCPAPNQGGVCNGCRACWNKKVEVVAYHTHGMRMKRLVREAKQENSYG